jgi:hypothetical protein
MIAACVGVLNKLEPIEAIALVRQHRSPRALETEAQIKMVWDLAHQGR